MYTKKLGVLDISFLKPTFFFNVIEDIPVELLQEMRIKVVFLDVDGTLAKQDSAIPFKDVKDWIVKVLNEKIEVVLLSNNFSGRVKTIADKFGVPFVSFAEKPLPFKALRAKKRLVESKAKSENCLIIGDQLFTDVLCGKFANMKSILVNSRSDNPYNFSFIRKQIEMFFRSKLKISRVKIRR